MLNNHHGIAAVGQSPQNLDQLVHIRKMESGRRLIQNVDRLSGASLGEFGCQLDSLRLSSRKLCGRLSQFYIGKSHIVERLDLAVDGRHIFKELQRLLHRHIQHIINAFSFILDLKRLPVVPLSLADLARHINIRQEMHLNL